MKVTTKFILLIITIGLISHNVISKVHKTHKKNKHTPKALDLNNIYGGPQIGSKYGPTTSYEEHVERNPDIFTPHRFNGWKNIEKFREFKPYPGWENRFSPHHIKSGDFGNVAPTANNLINPKLTYPKLHVQGEINYPSHVKMPTFFGFKKEYHDVSAYNKDDGTIIHDKMIVNKPQMGWEDRAATIKKEVNQYIDLRTGARIDYNEDKVKHGIDIEDEKKCHGKNRRLRRMRRRRI